MLGNLDARTIEQGRIEWACLPAALAHYTRRLGELFASLGKPLAAAELDQVRELLRRNLEEGFRAGSGAKLTVQYEITVAPTLQKNLALNISHVVPTMAQEFAGWSANKQGPLFGGHADARVIDVAAEFDATATRRTLDLGAGTGRNALALARSGWKVDAVELTPEFVSQIRTAAAQENLPVQVFESDLFDALAKSEAERYDLAILCEVVSHFRTTDQLRALLQQTAAVVRPGGRLLFNAFLTEEGYAPSSLEREMSQAAWASLFARDELRQALGDLPWQPLADDAVFDYERRRLPPAAWPPTGWFESWTNGRSIAPLEDGFPPFDMRWLLFERR